MEIRILHPIAHDNVLYSRGIWQTDDSAAENYLPESLVIIFLAIRTPDRLRGPQPVAIAVKPEPQKPPEKGKATPMPKLAGLGK